MVLISVVPAAPGLPQIRRLRRLKKLGNDIPVNPKGDCKISVSTEIELQEIGRRLTVIERDNPGSRIMVTSREPDGISVTLLYKYEGPVVRSFDAGTGKSSEVREEKYR